MDKKMYHHPQEDFFRKLNVPLPSATPHFSEDEILSNMKQLKPNTWKLEGNRLIGKTELGTLVQTIPTDVVLTGTDSNGLPVFKKIDI